MSYISSPSPLSAADRARAVEALRSVAEARSPTEVAPPGLQSDQASISFEGEVLHEVASALEMRGKRLQVLLLSASIGGQPVPGDDA